MKNINNCLYLIFKRIICAFLIINCFNFICGSYLVFIPVNIISIFIIAVFGIPGIISINLIYVLI